uniref:2,4-dichlorophenol 6-monooxygenase n=1 Tax=Anthurium amnicola TaxID=1678845 RepID=A0A1D1YFL0_9ARAE
MSKFVKRWVRPFFSSLQRIRGRRLSSLASSSAGLSKGGGGESGGGEIHVPVLIVGAGPVGLVLSLFLTKLGIKCAVIEKSIAFSQHPQAHFINNRSMELFCKLDGLADDIQRLQPPLDLWRKFVYCTSLSGTILGSVDHMQPQGCQGGNFVSQRWRSVGKKYLLQNPHWVRWFKEYSQEIDGYRNERGKGLAKAG